MKSIKSNTLLEDLMADVRQIILEANKLETFSTAMFQTAPAPGKWSMAQVLEHLNFYSRFYLAAIEQKLHQHQTRPANVFKPGWFGDYFTNMMKPTAQGKIKSKMKAMKSAMPQPQIDGRAALAQFIADQHMLLNLLQIAKAANLNTLRIPTSLSKLIALKLGDTFRFFIAHEQRHMLQVRNVLAMLEK